MKVKTIKPHVYGGVNRKTGEEYEMEERFYPPMAAFSNVIRIDDIGIQARDLQADEPRKYQRRDMRAK